MHSNGLEPLTFGSVGQPNRQTELDDSRRKSLLRSTLRFSNIKSLDARTSAVYTKSRSVPPIPCHILCHVLRDSGEVLSVRWMDLP
jgi:hypothetical protein